MSTPPTLLTGYGTLYFTLRRLPRPFCVWHRAYRKLRFPSRHSGWWAWQVRWPSSVWSKNNTQIAPICPDPSLTSAQKKIAYLLTLPSFSRDWHHTRSDGWGVDRAVVRHSAGSVDTRRHWVVHACRAGAGQLCGGSRLGNGGGVGLGGVVVGGKQGAELGQQVAASHVGRRRRRRAVLSGTPALLCRLYSYHNHHTTAYRPRLLAIHHRARVHNASRPLRKPVGNASARTHAQTDGQHQNITPPVSSTGRAEA